MPRQPAEARGSRAGQAGDRAIVLTVDAPVQGIRNILRAEPGNTMVLAGCIVTGGISRNFIEWPQAASASVAAAQRSLSPPFLAEESSAVS